MKALVTGGAGLIGSHIVDLLIAKGHQVRILDNLTKPTHLSGKPPWINPEAEFIEGDIRNRDDLDSALGDIDWVFHQAADGGFTNAISHYFTNNSLPTAVLYELIRDHHPVQKVITASSQAVYGEGKYSCSDHGDFHPQPRPIDQMVAGDWEIRCPICQSPSQGIPIDEEHVNPLLPYALSKYWNELLSLRLGKLYDIPTVALRYSLTYGPRQSLTNPYTGITSMFSTRILNDNPPIIYEDGLQTRDFIFVEDVARANLLVAESSRADHQVFNVGTGIATTIFDFAQTLVRIYKKEVKPLARNQFRPGDFRHLSTDANKLMSLGWKPQISLSEGLSKYRDWIQGFSSVEDYFGKAEEYLKATSIVMDANIH